MGSGDATGPIGSAIQFSKVSLAGTTAGAFTSAVSRSASPSKRCAGSGRGALTGTLVRKAVAIAGTGLIADGAGRAHLAKIVTGQWGRTKPDPGTIESLGQNSFWIEEKTGGN